PSVGERDDDAMRAKRLDRSLEVRQRSQHRATRGAKRRWGARTALTLIESGEFMRGATRRGERRSNPRRERPGAEDQDSFRERWSMQYRGRRPPYRDGDRDREQRAHQGVRKMCHRKSQRGSGGEVEREKRGRKHQRPW